MKGRIEVFILKEDLNEFMRENHNVQFWTNMPADYNSDDLLKMSIPLDTYNMMVNERSSGRSGKQLLTD